MAKLREGGLAALRELRAADNEESRAQANAEQNLKVLQSSRGFCHSCYFDAAASVREHRTGARSANFMQGY